MSSALDVVIVGAGPAGISAALWAHTLELRYEVLDAGASPGGQLHRVYGRVVDYLGVAEAADGAELAARFREHADTVGVRIRRSRPAVRVDVDGLAVETATESLAARYLVLATGVRRRTLGVPGEANVVGRGVSPSASRYAETFRAKRTLVVGGGDAAFEEALILAEACEHVTIVHRGDAPRARADFAKRVADHARIDVRARTELRRIDGEGDVSSARIEGPTGAENLPVAGVFVCVGVIPNTDLVHGALELDASGYVRVDSRQRASADRVYGVGDVCAGSSLTIAAAVGQGAAAIKDIQRRIGASRSGSDVPNR